MEPIATHVRPCVINLRIPMFEWNMSRLIVKNEHLKQTYVTMRWDHVLNNNRHHSRFNSEHNWEGLSESRLLNGKENLHFDLLATYSNFCISTLLLKLNIMCDICNCQHDETIPEFIQCSKPFVHI
jgi:hypothetical protein